MTFWLILNVQRWTESPSLTHGYLFTQVLYAMREYACTAVDIIARRTRLAFLNVHAAEEAVPRVIELMAKELNWSKDLQKVGVWHLEIEWSPV